MGKELFHFESCLHFKTLHLNNSYITDVFDNLSVVGEAEGMEHCWEFIFWANLYLLNAQEAK